MAWRRTGDKPLSEPMIVKLPMVWRVWHGLHQNMVIFVGNVPITESDNQLISLRYWFLQVLLGLCMVDDKQEYVIIFFLKNLKNMTEINHHQGAFLRVYIPL